MLHIERREFLVLLGSAAIAWPLPAPAQQPTLKNRRLGVLLPGPRASSTGSAMRARLGELGYTEGRNIILETRWAEGMPERVPELAGELAGLNLDAIIAYTTPVAIAARRATNTTPIVFLFVGDPVGAGVVPSLPIPEAMRPAFRCWEPN